MVNRHLNHHDWHCKLKLERKKVKHAVVPTRLALQTKIRKGKSKTGSVNNKVGSAN